MPQATMQTVASSNRKMCRTDHSMIRISMSVPLMRVAVGGFARASRCAGERRAANERTHSGTFLGELEADPGAGLEAAQQARILHLELHGHGRPFEARDRPVRDAHRPGECVDLLHGTFGGMRAS